MSDTTQSGRMESRASSPVRYSPFQNRIKKPNTKAKSCDHLSLPAKEHPVYPYFLQGLHIDRPNQVWVDDITYIPLAKGFMYLVAIIDWHSPYVLGWRLSNSLDSRFCVDLLKETLKNSQPEIFNTDQGSQFTSYDFVSVLENKDIRISMDGRGRALDNIIMIEGLWHRNDNRKLTTPGLG